MPDLTSGLISAGTSLLGSSMQSNAAGSASDAQSAMSQAAIDEQRRQFEAVQKILQPYVTSGTGALGQLSPYQQAGETAFGQQQNLLGLGGAAAQQSAYDQIATSPQMMALQQQGENAMLQNASATGGLRGGNLQGALAQFRPQLLNQLIDQQYSKLGGIASAGLGVTQNLASLGQNAAAGVGNAGMSAGNNISTLMGQQGAAQAGGILGQSAAYSGMLNAIPQGLGTYYGMTGKSPFSNTFGGSAIGEQYPGFNQSIGL